jgi:hypothetical protein
VDAIVGPNNFYDFSYREHDRTVPSRVLRSVEVAVWRLSLSFSPLFSSNLSLSPQTRQDVSPLTVYATSFGGQTKLLSMSPSTATPVSLNGFALVTPSGGASFCKVRAIKAMCTQ